MGAKEETERRPKQEAKDFSRVTRGSRIAPKETEKTEIGNQRGSWHDGLWKANACVLCVSVLQDESAATLTQTSHMRVLSKNNFAGTTSWQ